MPATAMSIAISMMEMKTRYCGDSNVLVRGSVFVIVNCTTKVGKSTETRVFNLSVKSRWGIKMQANPISVRTMGGTIVCSVKNSLQAKDALTP